MRDKELELELVTKLPRIICIKKKTARSFPYLHSCGGGMKVVLLFRNNGWKGRSRWWRQPFRDEGQNWSVSL